MESDNEITESVEILLERIEQQAKKIQSEFEETFQKVKGYRDSLEGDTSLIARPRMKIWLEKRGMPPILCFSDFFEVFLEEHRKEGRLDIGTRTIDLLDDARNLFRPKWKTTKIHILDFLGELHQLFE